jgi:hypothetical protein
MVTSPAIDSELMTVIGHVYSRATQDQDFRSLLLRDPETALTNLEIEIDPATKNHLIQNIKSAAANATDLLISLPDSSNSAWD